MLALGQKKDAWSVAILRERPGEGARTKRARTGLPSHPSPLGRGIFTCLEDPALWAPPRALTPASAYPFLSNSNALVVKVLGEVDGGGRLPLPLFLRLPVPSCVSVMLLLPAWGGSWWVARAVMFLR